MKIIKNIIDIFDEYIQEKVNELNGYLHKCFKFKIYEVYYSTSLHLVRKVKSKINLRIGNNEKKYGFK